MAQQRTLPHTVNHPCHFYWGIRAWWNAMFRASSSELVHTTRKHFWFLIGGNIFAKFVTLNHIPSAENHVGQLLKFYCLLLDTFMLQFPKRNFFFETAESIIGRRMFSDEGPIQKLFIILGIFNYIKWKYCIVFGTRLRKKIKEKCWFDTVANHRVWGNFQ